MPILSNSNHFTVAGNALLAVPSSLDCSAKSRMRLNGTSTPRPAHRDQQRHKPGPSRRPATFAAYCSYPGGCLPRTRSSRVRIFYIPDAYPHGYPWISRPPLDLAETTGHPRSSRPWRESGVELNPSRRPRRSGVSATERERGRSRTRPCKEYRRYALAALRAHCHRSKSPEPSA
jgi:hypothetical protein